MNFPVQYNEILQRVESVNPLQYARTRNFLNGAVTRLSPYISRGVISTRQVLENVLQRGYQPGESEKFIQELLWRDFFQLTALRHPRLAEEEIRQPQTGVVFHHVPEAVLQTSTGIVAIDTAIADLERTGYMHNHLRMYTASLICNIGKTHWYHPSRWMYYYLLDADFASNACSWQWVCGSFSNKKYYANQENINKYCGTSQKNTFLDVGYDRIADVPVPDVLKKGEQPLWQTPLPATPEPVLNPDLPVLVYNFYNLDPQWRKEEQANRILLLEPSHFETYPVSRSVIDFVLALSVNIPGVQVWCAEFEALKKMAGRSPVYFKEHPLFRHYSGTADARDQICPEVQGDFPSFFSYWNKCSRVLKRRYE